MLIRIITIVMVITTTLSNNLILMMEIVSGLLTGIILWLLFNVLLTPTIEIGDEIVFNGKKRYIKVWNKSRFDIYEVVYRVEYWYGEAEKVYKRTNNPIPYLEKNGGMLAIPLGGDNYSNQFFENINDNSHIIIFIFFQNKYGVKKMARKEINIL